jgi:phosphoglycolate phosphatase-like HAD superfamily hydrolase
MDNQIIITDLDGTISDYSHRQHFYTQKMYDEFNKMAGGDTSIEEICNILRRLKDDETDIYIITAREETYRQLTENWLNIYEIPFDRLLMRKKDDDRPDAKIKLELYQENVPDQDHVWFVLEDRNVCVSMWRSIGLKCLQVADGRY